jgi:hypothetical protein
MLKEINKAAVSDVMRKAVENPALGLNTEAYFRLDDDKENLVRTRALLSLIYEKPLGGYPDIKAVQDTLDGIVPRLNGTADPPEPDVSSVKESDTRFFPLGVWLQSPENTRAYKDIGINTFVGLWKGLDGAALDYFSRTDMRVICELNKYAAEYIKDNPDDRTITGWMHWDEPDNAQNTGSGWGPPVDPGSVIVKYNRIKRADPTRPVFLGLGQGVAHRYIGRGIDTGKDHLYPLYIKGADIVCFDIYPANGDGDGDKLWLVPHGIDNLIAWSGGNKPVWAWIETGSINGTGRPTPKQIKAEVWMAIIHGAKGIGYFMHEFKPVFHEAGLLTDEKNSANRDMVASVNALITSLAPQLNSPSQDLASVTSAGIPVDIMTKIYDGEIYIFAASMREGETAADFTLSCPTGSKAEVIGENRTLEVTDGKFTDAFVSYDIHIYKITKK